MPVSQNERASVVPDQDKIQKSAELGEGSPRIEYSIQSADRPCTAVDHVGQRGPIFPQEAQEKRGASMNWTTRRDVTGLKVNTSAKVDHSRIRALIDEATTDSNDESDEHAGLLSMIGEEVVCPFPARVQGEDVECIRFEWPKNGYGLNAVCRTRQGKTRIVDIATLEWLEPRPGGYEWVEAYFAWRELVG